MKTLKLISNGTSTLKQNAIHCLWNLFAVMAIILCNLTPVSCEDLMKYDGVNALAYIAGYGVHWLWLVGLALLVISLACSGQTKQVIRGMAIGVFVAWVICIFVNGDSSSVQNTFNTIKEKLIGTSSSGT